MSDTMLFGVLRMPYELAMSDELSRFQFYGRAQQAADEIERLRESVERLERRVDDLDESESQLIDERDSAEEALRQAHIALGGDGEWTCKMGSAADYPPDSGDLRADVPALAEEVVAELSALRAKIEAAPVVKVSDHEVIAFAGGNHYRVKISLLGTAALVVAGKRVRLVVEEG